MKKNYMKKYKNKNYKIDESSLFVYIVLIYLSAIINAGITIYRAYKLINTGIEFKDVNFVNLYLNIPFIIIVGLFIILYLYSVYKKFYLDKGIKIFIPLLLISYIPVIIAIFIPSIVWISFILWGITNFFIFNSASTKKNLFKIVLASFISIVGITLIFNNIIETVCIVIFIIVIALLCLPGGSKTSTITNTNSSLEPQILHYPIGTEFVVVKGALGDKIETKTGASVCSYDNYKRGNVIIMCGDQKVKDLK